MSVQSAPVSVLPKKLTLIDGEWLTSGEGGKMQHVYAATGKATVEYNLAGRAEVERAVSAANAAFPNWAQSPPNVRRDVLLRFATVLERDADEIVQIATIENGAPLSKARLHLAAAIDQFRYMAGWADKISGDVLPSWPAPGFDYTLREPIGVIALLIPWNAPMHILGATLAPALAIGNSVIIKPSELSPFTSAKFAALLMEAGLPDGVLSVLPAAAEGGGALIRHQGIDKIHFTGSNATARKVLAGALENLTPVGLELGGKSARIVFADCDLEAAARDALSAALSISGQGCLLGTRVLIQETIYEAFLERCRAMLSKVIIGDPLADGTDMGPVVSESACARILGVIEEAKNDPDARLIAGGSRLGGDLADGFFIEPTIFADVDNASSLAQNEVFGPVIAMMKFRDEADAISIANNSAFGLAAYLHCNDISRAHRIAARLDVGNIWINGFFFAPTIPFGGVKQSGYGRTGGKAGIEEFSRLKNIWVST